MSRASHLKDLSDELRYLFEQNASEQEAYDEVKEDARFNAVRLAKVSAMYEQFRSEKGKKLKRKKSFDPKLTELIRRSGQLAYFRSTLECNHEKNWCLKFLNGWSSDGRFFATPDRTIKANNTSSFSLKDIFSNKTCHVKVLITRTAEAYTFWPLTHYIGLLIERTDYNFQQTFAGSSLSLMELDWTEKKIRTIHRLTIEDHRRGFQLNMITVDAMDPTRFLLISWHGDGSLTLKLGQVRNNEILLEEDIFSMDQEIGVGFTSLIGKTLYTSHPLDLTDEPCMYVTRLDQDEQTLQVMLDSIPQQFSTVEGKNEIIGCFAMERLYLAVRHKKTEHYGLIWTSSETQQWGLVEFCIKEPITCIKFMINGHFLCIQATDNETKLFSDVHKVQKTIYRIPLKIPEKLSDLAWFSLVRSKSKLKGVNPYEEARRYLPFYSEIRFPFEE
jgi:hypothetical protein